MPIVGGGVSAQEILLLAVLAVLLFGTKRLPELGRSAGTAVRELRDSIAVFKQPLEDVKELTGAGDANEIAAHARPAQPRGEPARAREPQT